MKISYGKVIGIKRKNERKKTKKKKKNYRMLKLLIKRERERKQHKTSKMWPSQNFLLCNGTTM